MSQGKRLSFYGSDAWKKTRSAYKKSVGGLCENCLRKGIYKPAEIVHHKIHLDDVQIENPEVALSWSNLEALCRDCHGEEHGASKRYKLDEFGRVIFKDEPTESISHSTDIQCR